jgi:Fibronectin type III domain
MKNLRLKFHLLTGSLFFLFFLLVSSGCEPTDKPCEPPTNVTVTGISPTSATISWSAPPGATVEISVSPQPTPPGPFTTTDSTFTITGLSPDTDYKITVRTKCADGVYSDPVIIALKTTTIIIVDVIVQKEAILSEAISICASPVSDDVNAPMPINWDSSKDKELLAVSDGTPNTMVLIFKRKNTSGVFEYFAIANNYIICGITTKNTPTSVQNIINGARLVGSNYNIDLTPGSAILTPNTTATVLYSMYR